MNEHETVTDEFQQTSENIVKDYIRSVLFVDDDWPEDNPQKKVSDSTREFSESLQSDDSVSAYDSETITDESDLIDDEASEDIDAASSEQDKFPDMPSAAANSQLLGFKESVTGEGIIFQGIAYRKSHHEKIIVDLASRADIVVFDWELVWKDKGRETLSILQELVNKGGLRFICIFTNKQRVHEIKERIKERLSDEKPDSSEDVDKANSDGEIKPGPSEAVGKADTEKGEIAEFRIKNLVIAVRKKPNGVNGDSDDYTVEPKDLLGEAIKALTREYRGFVQLILLEMTNKHRELLPRVLERIDSDIDAAYIAEATDDDSPIKRSDAFIGILLDEWRAQLKKIASQVLSENTIKAYCSALISKTENLDESLIRENLFSCISGDRNKLVNNICKWTSNNANCFNEWLKSGCPTTISGLNLKDKDKKEQKSIKLSLLNYLISSNNNPKKAVLKLDALFHQRREVPQKLSQGTVLCAKKDSYLICVTPACDTERPEDKINYIYCFLTADIVAENRLIQKNRTEPYIILNHNEKTVILKVKLKPYQSLYIPNPEINAENKLVAFLRIPEDPMKKPEFQLELSPIAQLRLEHALSLSAAAGAEATRVGVDRVEFVRSRLK
ncbi:hypothetical protein DENIS_0534 [Desulfonema ishimotonii]|uniref:Response receiver domain-containing protein n=1 Tax=Desulfonema ishimotonii TaxID=45657 RepID=A0A401FRK9_9BACT|nr:response regulator receiver domain [Desulfonema ishimotonii]GBC59595.1 hypothetical protein DENIS_0534 [Desulfonema ishimotonii]